jgi:uncharacterized protein YqgC (DUF456 family)
MDILWLIIGIIFMLVGIAGCLLPLLPGPPLSFAGLLILQLRETSPYSTEFLLWWAGITAVVTILDYFIPIYGTKKFGGSRYGVWGSGIGLVAGLFFPPVGIILGPFIGAFIGEMIFSNNSQVAFKAALGSFLGFLIGTLLKVVVCLVMAWYLLLVIIKPDQIIA